MNFDTKSLICFKKVAELEHMTKAAQELYISQAQLSRVINDLEEQFGVKFFDRVGKGIKLNACGKVFYQYTQQMFDITAQAQKKTREIYLHEQSQVTIFSNCSAYMPAVLPKLKNISPDLKFRQLSGTRKKCISLLKEGSVDFSICCSMIEDPEITSVFLRKEPAIVIYPAGHWLEHREHVSLFELQNENFIGQSTGYGTREALDTSYRKYHFEPNYIVESNETFLITKLVDANLGISVVPKSLFERDPIYKFRHCEIDEPVYGNVGLSWQRSRVLSDLDQQCIDSIVDSFAMLSE